MPYSWYDAVANYNFTVIKQTRAFFRRQEHDNLLAPNRTGVLVEATVFGFITCAPGSL